MLKTNNLFEDNLIDYRFAHYTNDLEKNFKTL